MSAPERLSVGVVVERRELSHRWQTGASWTVIGLQPAAPGSVKDWSCLAEGHGWRHYYAGAVEIELFRGETEGYRDNLGSARPAVYVILRRDPKAPCGIVLHAATVDPGEIEAHSDAGDDIIEAVAMPPLLGAWVASFVARHHVEQPFYKRQRDRADPEILAQRRRVRPGREGGLG